MLAGPRSLEDLRENLPCLCQLPVVAGNSWHSWVCICIPQSLPPSSHDLLPCVCLCVSSSYKHATHIGLRAHPIPLWLLLTNCISDVPISKSDHIQRSQDWNIYFLGDTIQPVIHRDHSLNSSLKITLCSHEGDHGDFWTQDFFFNLKNFLYFKNCGRKHRTEILPS